MCAVVVPVHVTGVVDIGAAPIRVPLTAPLHPRYRCCCVCIKIAPFCTRTGLGVVHQHICILYFFLFSLWIDSENDRFWFLGFGFWFLLCAMGFGFHVLGFLFCALCFMLFVLCYVLCFIFSIFVFIFIYFFIPRFARKFVCCFHPRFAWRLFCFGES